MGPVPPVFGFHLNVCLENFIKPATEEIKHQVEIGEAIWLEGIFI